MSFSQTSNEVKNHELTTVDISTIRFDETNPNKLTQKQMEGLRQSMLKYGYLTPVIIDQNNVVADGEHRLLVYKQLGYNQIPVFKVDLQTDTDRKILRQVMNKLHGEHDKQLDSNELLQVFQENKLSALSALIAQQQYDLQQTIRQYHPDIFFEKPEGEFNLDKTLEEIVPTTQLGDLYQLGNHRLICADCTDTRSIGRLLQQDKCNLVLTDPPYGIDLEYNQYEDKTGSDYIDFCRAWFPLAKTRADLSIITTGWKYKEFWYNEFKPDDEMIWYDKTKQSGGRSFYLRKTEPIMIWGNIKNKFDWDIIEAQSDRGDGMHSQHVCPKPLALLTNIIERQTEPNDIIFDPFLGSGTTLIAAEQTNRKCYGVEIDPHYCDVIISRWEKYTGKKAEKIQ